MKNLILSILLHICLLRNQYFALSTENVSREAQQCARCCEHSNTRSSIWRWRGGVYCCTLWISSVHCYNMNDGYKENKLLCHHLNSCCQAGLPISALNAVVCCLKGYTTVSSLVLGNFCSKEIKIRSVLSSKSLNDHYCSSCLKCTWSIHNCGCWLVRWYLDSSFGSVCGFFELVRFVWELGCFVVVGVFLFVCLFFVFFLFSFDHMELWNESCLSGWPAEQQLCLAKSLMLDITQTEPNFLYLPCLYFIDTIDCYHVIPLSLTLTLLGVTRSAWCITHWCHFLTHFPSELDEIWCDEAIQAEQPKNIFWNNRNNCCFTECVKELKRWHAFGCWYCCTFWY